jgi:hypothetical protein
MSRTLFPIAASSFDVLILNMRRCVSRSNVKCSASAEAAVLQDSSSFSANFFWCIRFALVVVQLLLAIEVHSARVTKRTLLHGSPSTSSVVKRSRESYLPTSLKHSPKNKFRFHGIVMFCLSTNSRKIYMILQSLAFKRLFSA